MCIIMCVFQCVACSSASPLNPLSSPFASIGLHVHRSKDGFLRQFDVHHAAVLDLIFGAEHREAHIKSALAANHGTNRHLGRGILCGNGHPKNDERLLNMVQW